MIARHQVIQTYLDLWVQPRYLEVGVSEGETFHAVKAAHKVAVDPVFQIKEGGREPASEYYEVTSDKYFDDLDTNIVPFDVIYLDGLHTFEQTLRDLMNALDFLRPDGVIVIDDVRPNSYSSGLPDLNETYAVRRATQDHDLSWMGNVYRLVYFIQSFLPRFNYATVADNHGQLVMWRGKRDPALFVPRQVEDIARMEFRHLINELPALNLLPNATIGQMMQQAVLDRSLTRPARGG
jgi:hypothetical protein